MKKNVLRVMLCLILVTIFIIPKDVCAQDVDANEMSAVLRKVVLDNFKAYEKEDIAQVMATVHTQSPGYVQTKSFSEQLFPMYDLKYELIDFKYLMIDGEYALARAKQKTSKISGPAFKDNILDLIFVYKQENGVWKFWSQVILTIDYVQ